MDRRSFSQPVRRGRGEQREGIDGPDRNQSIAPRSDATMTPLGFSLLTAGAALAVVVGYELCLTDRLDPERSEAGMTTSRRPEHLDPLASYQTMLWNDVVSIAPIIGLLVALAYAVREPQS